MSVARRAPRKSPAGKPDPLTFPAEPSGICRESVRPRSFAGLRVSVGTIVGGSTGADRASGSAIGFPGCLGRRAVLEWAEDSFLAMRSFVPRRLVNPTILRDEELAGLQMPTLFLVGDNEKIYSAQSAVARIQRVAPRIAAEIVPGAGHDLTIVQAEIINERIMHFLRGA